MRRPGPHALRPLALALLLLAGACAGIQEGGWVQDTLFFGLSRPGGQVSAAEWQDFVDHSVTPLFPDGLTSWPASGQWRGEGQSVQREDSRVLLIVHAPSAQADAALDSICAQYKRRFDQESVLRVRETVQARF